MDRYLMVMLGGAAGTLLRYMLTVAITNRTGTRFPLATVGINITGSFLAGLLITLFAERFNPHPNVRLLLVVGFLGGYTTFSSFEWETFNLVREGTRWLGLLNAVGSVAVGYLAVWLGAAIAAKR